MLRMLLAIGGFGFIGFVAREVTHAAHTAPPAEVVVAAAPVPSGPPPPPPVLVLEAVREASVDEPPVAIPEPPPPPTIDPVDERVVLSTDYTVNIPVERTFDSALLDLEGNTTTYEVPAIDVSEISFSSNCTSENVYVVDETSTADGVGIEFSGSDLPDDVRAVYGSRIVIDSAPTSDEGAE
ncbi:MAG TPA: hypothetical protein VFQ53_19375 [Kofleriaceae bacterium]|nr:hypothetical protein [Kofleriaceae bacterium]